MPHESFRYLMEQMSYKIYYFLQKKKEKKDCFMVTSAGWENACNIFIYSIIESLIWTRLHWYERWSQSKWGTFFLYRYRSEIHVKKKQIPDSNAISQDNRTGCLLLRRLGAIGFDNEQHSFKLDLSLVNIKWTKFAFM